MIHRDIYDAAIYCRLSSEDESRSDSVSIQNQKTMLTKFVQENQWRIVGCYVDDGVSGTTFERDGFKRMLGDIEQGKINMVVTKDLSRLGRDYLKTGYYTEVYFPERDVRYIALNDGIDTLKKDNDIAPFKNILNEMYARDISKKVKSAYKVKSARGDYHGAFAPFGYAKDPEDGRKLIIDEESAATVRLIFQLASQGYGCAKLRHYLSDNKFLTPAAYLHKKDSKQYTNKYRNAPDGDSIYYAWANGTVANILHNQVYLGNIVHYKQMSVSYKSKKCQPQPKDKWVITENTHPPLIERELWELVQERMKQRSRGFQTCKYPNIFNKIVRCADCGWNMQLSSYSVSKTGKRYYENRYFSCLTNRDYGKNRCTTHSAIYKELYQLVLDDIRGYAKLAVEKPETLLNSLSATEETKRRVSLNKMQGEYEQGKKRLADLINLLQKLFEQNVSGLLNDTNYAAMFSKYQKEQGQLELRVKELEKQLSSMKQDEDNSQKWVALISKYADLQELDAPIVNELCEKILVHEAQKVDGIRTQKIEIYYRFVGKLPAMEAS
jgi:DNA invertase Pin-like site-specific DNA recombinase